MTVAPEQWLTGGGKSAKLENIGESIGGDIIDDPQMMQQRDYETGDPIVYADGNPAMQMVIRLQTTLRDPADPEDDGIRCVYVKGQLKSALMSAMRSSGDKVPRRGGQLTVTLTGLEPTQLKNGRPGNAKKIHAVQYTPPRAAAAAGYLAADSARPAQTGAVATPPASSAAPPAPQWPDCPTGIDPGAWKQMTATQKAQMYQALGLPVPQAPPAGPRFDDVPAF